MTQGDPHSTENMYPAGGGWGGGGVGDGRGEEWRGPHRTSITVSRT